MLMLVSKRWMIKQLDVKCAFLLLGSNTTGNLTAADKFRPNPVQIRFGPTHMIRPLHWILRTHKGWPDLAVCRDPDHNIRACSSSVPTNRHGLTCSSNGSNRGYRTTVAMHLGRVSGLLGPRHFQMVCPGIKRARNRVGTGLSLWWDHGQVQWARPNTGPRYMTRTRIQLLFKDLKPV